MRGHHLCRKKADHRSMETLQPPGANTHLRNERIGHNWRQHELAELLGTSVDSVKRWEQGRQQPSAYFRAKLCTLFGKSAQQLGLLPEEGPLWSLPFARNPFFTGRQPLLEHLHSGLKNPAPRAGLLPCYSVHGLGGIGKTQLALEYAYRYRSQYRAVLWVQAETSTSLISGYGRLATVFALPEQAEEDHHQMVAAVIRWLNGHGGWLLIFDNVEDLSVLKPFLPANDQGALLLTTRLQTAGSLAQPIELPTMTVQEGTDFLLVRTRRHTQGREPTAHAQQAAAAQTITIQMGGLPLALEQAGAYISATGCSLSTYLHLFEQKQDQLLAMQEPSSDHPLSVSQTFGLSFQQVERRNPLATDLLTVCAYLAPDAVPEIFWQQGAGLLGPTLASIQLDPLAFPEALKVLLSYSLLSHEGTSQMLSTHRLVQVILRGRLTPAEQHIWIRRVLATMEHLFPADEERQATYLLLGDQFLTHAQTVLQWAEHCQQDEALRVSLMSHVATYLTRRARYEEARSLFTSAIHLGAGMLGENHLLVAEAIHGLASLSFEQGQYAEATVLAERALAIRQQGTRPEHPQLAVSLDLLGTLSNEQGHNEQAEQYYQQALQLREQTLAPHHPHLASSLLNLGILYRQQRKYEQAEPLLQRAARLREQVLGPEHPQVAAALYGLGVLYARQGTYERAEQYYQRALHIQERTLGPEHPQIATTLNSLGVLYDEQGKQVQAEQQYRHALQIMEQALGLHHVRLARTLNNLGAICQDQENYAQAEEYYQRALGIWEQALGPEHPELAIPLSNLGELSSHQGNYERAEQYYQRALHIRERTLGPEHPDMAYIFHGLANVSREQGKYEDARRLYHCALSLREQHLSPQHPELAETLHDLARFHQVQKQTIQALSCYQQALLIRQEALGPHHPKTQDTQSALNLLL